MTAFQPTGVVSPDRTSLEVVDPQEPGGFERPHMVTVPQYLASADGKYLATHPWDDPRKPFPQDEPAFNFGRGARKVWNNLNASDTGSGIASGVLGAGAGLAGSYALDALGYKLFGKEPMGVGGRTLAALAGALLTSAGQQYYRRTSRDNAILNGAPPPPTTLKMSSATFDVQQVMRVRQMLASQVMSSDIPVDFKSQILQALSSMAGPQLMALARFVAPIGGALAGAAIAKFIFGNSFLPQLLGGLAGGMFGRSTLRPRLNAIGQEMI